MIKIAELVVTTVNELDDIRYEAMRAGRETAIKQTLHTVERLLRNPTDGDMAWRFDDPDWRNVAHLAKRCACPDGRAMRPQDV